MYRVHWLDPDWETKWGLGFATWRSNDKTYVGHGGSCPGYRSHLNIEPQGSVATIFMSNAGGVNSGNFTGRAQDMVGPAIAAALDTGQVTEPLDTELERYVGTYDESPWWGETAVVIWKGKLSLVSLPTDDPLESLTQLEHITGHAFRRVRDDGSLGEEIRFDVGPDGRATRMWRHSNASPRVR